MVLETYTDVNELIGSETINKRSKRKKSIEIPWEERTSGGSRSRELVWKKVCGHLFIKGDLETDSTARPSLVAQTVKNLPVMWETGFDPWVGKIPGRRAWQPTAVFLPVEPHGQRSLAGYSPWGCMESDRTEVTALTQGESWLWLLRVGWGIFEMQLYFAVVVGTQI